MEGVRFFFIVFSIITPNRRCQQLQRLLVSKLILRPSAEGKAAYTAMLLWP
jgi:hypothetical protein